MWERIADSAVAVIPGDTVYLRISEIEGGNGEVAATAATSPFPATNE